MPSFYGVHTRGSSLVTFGFSLPAQLSSATLRLPPPARSEHASAILAVLDAAGEGPESCFELTERSLLDSSSEAGGLLDATLMQCLRLLALPPAEAALNLGAAVTS